MPAADPYVMILPMFFKKGKGETHNEKKFITFIAILNLIFFSSISSAHAFIDPASLTLIFGAAFVTVVTGSELIRDSQAEPAQAQIQKEVPVKGQAREKTDKITETQIGADPAPSGS